MEFVVGYSLVFLFAHVHGLESTHGQANYSIRPYLHSAICEFDRLLSGALRTLGEEFPAAKLEEIRTELIEDAKSDGAISLLKSQINAAIASLTGILPEDGGEMPPGAQPGDGTGPGPSGQPGIVTPFEAETIDQMSAELVSKAYGTTIPKNRGVDTEESKYPGNG